MKRMGVRDGVAQSGGAALSGAAQAEARLLVVEDDANILELLSASLRFAGRPGWQSGRPQWPTPPSRPKDPPVPPDGRDGQAAADLERAVGQLSGEVHRLARQAGVSAAELRAATAVVSSALTELRRLLRG